LFFWVVTQRGLQLKLPTFRDSLSVVQYKKNTGAKPSQKF